MLTRTTVILLSNDEQRHAAEELVHRMVKRAVELEGTVTVRDLHLFLSLSILCNYSGWVDVTNSFFLLHTG